MTLGGGDALARGARSAQFSGPGADVDDEVVLNPSVVAPEEPELKLDVVDKRRFMGLDTEVKAKKVEPKEFPDRQYTVGTPIIDRVLIMRVSVNPDEEILEDGSVMNKRTGFITAAGYHQHTNTGIVMSTGEFFVIGQHKIPISEVTIPGDLVYYGDYNSELFDIAEEDARRMCKELKVNYEKTEAGWRLIRVQDIRLVKKPVEVL